MDDLTLLDIDLNSKGKNKKRKWREIEALQDEYRLRKELEEFDLLEEYDLRDLAS
ncbi:DUF3545 family protein [Bowmanella sp. JS7-9]|uniref:DUF3545 family protein n=1 Tax=Pseudobowmanella zhangzhouensis TaxID=1537679 RepID=A0ABW1XHK4_9ALTE|nr:DUF3545 family protein [Bowmanella sp. JS7-9]